MGLIVIKEMFQLKLKVLQLIKNILNGIKKRTISNSNGLYSVFKISKKKSKAQLKINRTRAFTNAFAQGLKKNQHRDESV